MRKKITLGATLINLTKEKKYRAWSFQKGDKRQTNKQVNDEYSCNCGVTQ